MLPVNCSSDFFPRFQVCSYGNPFPFLPSFFIPTSFWFPAICRVLFFRIKTVVVWAVVLETFRPDDDFKISLQPVTKVVETSCHNERQLFARLSLVIFPPSPAYPMLLAKQLRWTTVIGGVGANCYSVTDSLFVIHLRK